MKCVWDIVSVHVSLHGISDCRCCYKVSANEFCQRQLWTWWNGQRGDEKLALCGLGRCCTATPASLYTLCLTCAVCVRKNSALRSNRRCCARGRVICSSTFALFIFVPQPDPNVPGRSMAQSDVHFPGPCSFCRPRPGVFSDLLKKTSEFPVRLSFHSTDNLLL